MGRDQVLTHLALLRSALQALGLFVGGRCGVCLVYAVRALAIEA